MKEIVDGSIEAVIVRYLDTRTYGAPKFEIEQYVVSTSAGNRMQVESALGILRTESHGIKPWVQTVGHGKNMKYVLTEFGRDRKYS